MQNRVSVTIPVFNDKVLLLKRSTNDDTNGLWNFPGGSVELDENIQDAAARELFEEAGIKVKTTMLDYLGYLNTKHNRLYFYIIEVKNDSVFLNDESSDFVWAEIDSLIKFKMPGREKINRNLLDAITKYINGE